MKKISLLLALSLMLTIFTGCGNANTETTAPSTTAPTESTAPTETLPIPTDPPNPEVIDYDMNLPEGFIAQVVEENFFRFVSPMAPEDTSFISVERIALEEEILTMGESAFVERIDPTREPQPTEPEETTVPSEPVETSDPAETTAPAETTKPVETTQPTEPVETVPVIRPEEMRLLTYQETTVDGWNAIACDYVLVFDDYKSRVLRYEVVVNDCNYVFTFADNTKDNDWLDLYKETIESIDMILNTEGIELDYTGLTLYDLECGMSIWAENGMKHHKAEGFTACIGSRNVIILVMADNKESNHLTGMSLDDYADLLCQTNELSGFKWDTYGSLCINFYSTDATGMDYYNMICVKETEEDFWVFQMACSAENQAKYAKAFSLWASSIQEK